MKRLSGSALFLALGYLGFVLFEEASAAYRAEVVDQSRVVVLFGSLVIVGLLMGVVAAFTLVPAFGERLGSFFFNPDRRIEASPHAAALVALARGDFPEAITAYARAFEANPHDTHALSEMARIYCEKLGDPASAANILEQALEAQWPQDEAAFLTQRLAEVCWSHQHNARRARELLLQIIETFPGTRQAANATHRLQEIERKLASED